MLKTIISGLLAAGLMIIPSAADPDKPGHGATVQRMQTDFRKLEFGMFLHYNMATYTGEEWVTGYSDPSTFNPGGVVDTDAWADAAVSAGMKYGVLTVKHVGGFCLWDSKYTTYELSGWDKGDPAFAGLHSKAGHPMAVIDEQEYKQYINSFAVSQKGTWLISVTSGAIGYAKVYVKRSEDKGRTWSPERIPVYDPREDLKLELREDFDCEMGQLFPVPGPIGSKKTQRIYQFSIVRDVKKGARFGKLIYTISEDDGRTWTGPGGPGTYWNVESPVYEIVGHTWGWHLMAPPRLTRDGRMILPMNASTDPPALGDIRCEPVYLISKNILAEENPGKVEFSFSPPPPHGVHVPLEKKPGESHGMEAQVVELSDGRLFSPIRTGNGCIYFTTSADGGTTWAKALPLRRDDDGPLLLNPNCANPLTKLSNGTYAILHCNNDGNVYGVNDVFRHNVVRHPIYVSVGVENPPGRRQPIRWSAPRLMTTLEDYKPAHKGGWNDLTYAHLHEQDGKFYHFYNAMWDRIQVSEIDSRLFLPPGRTPEGANEPVPIERLREDFLSWKFGMFLHFNMATFHGVEWATGHEDPATFAPGQLDCDQWMEAAVSAGMRYAVLTVKHTGGWCLWDSAHTTHDIAAFTNFKGGKGDIVREFVDACRRHNIKVGLYYCFPGDYSHSKWSGKFPNGAENLNGMPPEAKGDYVGFIKKQFDELLTHYGPIDLLWIDQWMRRDTNKAWPAIIRHIKSLQPNCLVLGNNSHDFATTDIHSYEFPALIGRGADKALPPEGNPHPAEVSDYLGSEWFWDTRESAANIKTADEVVAKLKLCNGRRSNYLLNVAPDASGRIPEHSVKRLREIGKLTGTTPSGAGQWSVEKANAWYDAQPWPCGFNYIPAHAISYTEMWMPYNFDPAEMDKELALARDIGFNCLRVVLPFVVWEHDPAAFKERFQTFLEVCGRRGIRVMPCFFDDCAFGSDDKLKNPWYGRQPEVLEGWYASGWTPSPGHDMVRDPQTWHRLEKYVTDIMTTFKDNPQVWVWDLYNEPGNANMGDVSLPLAERVFRWARAVNPSQPLTLGQWNDNSKLNAIIFANSDIITFHNYSGPEVLTKQIQKLKEHGRPVINTEWLNRSRKSTVADCLPLFARDKVGCMHWGLVNGKTQTDLGWGWRPGRPEPEVWQHDLFHGDHRPYAPAEIALFKKAVAESR